MHNARITAASSLILVATAVASLLAFGTGATTGTAIVAAGIVIAILLQRGYLLASGAEALDIPAFRHFVKPHILLHIVPASYLLMRIYADTGLLHDYIYVLPLLLFFWTGRRSWQAMLRLTGRKVYLIFMRGNTGMMVMPVVILILGGIFPASFLSGMYGKLIAAYTIIHMAITGAVIVLMEKDLQTHPHQRG